MEEGALLFKRRGHEKIGGFARGGGAQLFKYGWPLALFQKRLEFLFVGIVHRNTEEPTTFLRLSRRRLSTGIFALLQDCDGEFRATSAGTTWRRPVTFDLAANQSYHGSGGR